MKMYNIALEILKKLNEKGFESYIIGGYARDKYLGIESNDIDICTSAKYNDIKKIFPNIKNNNFSSYQVTYKDYEFEITTFRKEKKYLKNRFPKKIKYTKKITSDLKRRDFIMNTLCIDENGNYIDFYNAKTDLDNKIIRLVGSKKKLKQDALRILRAIRLATILDFEIDEKLQKGIIKYKEYLNNISYDRKKKELDKIFTSQNVLYGISLIKKMGLEKHLSIKVDKVIKTDKIGIWSQVLNTNAYPFTKEENKKIKLIQNLTDKQFDLYDLYLYGIETFKIVNKIKQEEMDIEKIYKKIPIKDRSEIDIDFFEISETIYTTNGNIGKIYEDIEKQIVYQNIKNNKKAIKKYLVENYKNT